MTLLHGLILGAQCNSSSLKRTPFFPIRSNLSIEEQKFESGWSTTSECIVFVIVTVSKSCIHGFMGSFGSRVASGIPKYISEMCNNM